MQDTKHNMQHWLFFVYAMCGSALYDCYNREYQSSMKGICPGIPPSTYQRRGGANLMQSTPHHGEISEYIPWLSEKMHLHERLL